MSAATRAAGPAPGRTTSNSALRRRWTYDRPKRVIDVCGALIGLAVAAPALLVAALAIKLTDRGPVMFRAERVGRGGVTFPMLKLRTMYVDADHSAQREFNRLELLGELDALENYTIVDDPRITPVGSFLRKTSIDELPQLVNVLKGEMSLVGPRPSVEWEVALFEPRYRRREDVLPGITGLWQVTGRRTIDMRGMLELDLEYVDSRTLFGDMAILVKTVPAVLNSTGAS